MLDVHRIKKTGQIIYPLGKHDNNYTLCLFPFKRETVNGKRAAIQIVRNENIVKDRENG